MTGRRYQPGDQEREAELEKRFPDPCFWNPETKQAAYGFEVHASAEWIVGHEGKWRLCDACAQLPEFKRFRKRARIVRNEGA